MDEFLLEGQEGSGENGASLYSLLLVLTSR